MLLPLGSRNWLAWKPFLHLVSYSAFPLLVEWFGGDRLLGLLAEVMDRYENFCGRQVGDANCF